MMSQCVSVRRVCGVRAALAACTCLLAASSVLIPRTALSQQIQGAIVSDPVTPEVFTQDLTTLEIAPPWQPGDPIGEIPLQQDEDQSVPSALISTARTSAGQPAPALATTLDPDAIGSPSMPTLNFEGISFGGLVPPDTNGDVGPNHYIQVVNVRFQIFNKQGGTLAGPFLINSLWAGFGGPCAAQNGGDPIVNYDPLADRWLLSQITPFSTTFHECIAISRTGDPVHGGWFLYDFQLHAVNDYPKIGVWPDAYYLTSQRGFPGAGLQLVAFDRAQMLNGNPATFQTFFLSPPSLVLLPSDLDGPAPPLGTPNFLAREVDGDLWGGVDRVELFALSINWANPALSTLSALPSLPTAPFDSVLCTAGNLNDNCVPQPGTSVLLETSPNWPMWRLQYRNFGTHETLVFNHTVNVAGTRPGRAGVRWYELRRPPGGAWTIFQQGTQSPDSTLHRWMGSIAMDRFGSIALGYSVSSFHVFPQIRYTTRASTDPPGTFSDEVTLVQGTGSQTITSRWGDYSSMNVDPVDECTFWYTQEYMVAGGLWRTRIGTFHEMNSPCR